jgi:Transcription factor Pcc1
MTRDLQQQLDVTVSVNVPFSNSAEAKSAMKALIPDNVNFPRGLSMKIFSISTTLVIRLKGKNVPTSTILNTLDEVLEHISISKKVMAS